MSQTTFNEDGSLRDPNYRCDCGKKMPDHSIQQLIECVTRHIEEGDKHRRAFEKKYPNWRDLL